MRLKNLAPRVPRNAYGPVSMTHGQCDAKNTFPAYAGSSCGGIFYWQKWNNIFSEKKKKTTHYGQYEEIITNKHIDHNIKGKIASTHRWMLWSAWVDVGGGR